MSRTSRLTAIANALAALAGCEAVQVDRVQTVHADAAVASLRLH